ncbi:hypothetical protein FHL15_010876 [Xylaria flabelliformis]|uniref:D-isomer specific 2-hydroxyacid dehydrogenase NAD-binding domain-containing protein n=1 Tax=Xylaria flabelliformis TaxID=2512241 RepID=A0A553HJX6_9PEZI|nr:hypothetical protein FHL15_010876 [Xylaria flabelliformis]
MAEPTNTPMPTAPPTPRSASPAPPLPTSGGSLTSSPTTTRIPQWPHAAAAVHSQTHSRATSLTVPVHSSGPKPIVLHLGDPVKYNPETYAEFSVLFDVVRPNAEERARPAFIAALREKRWGDFAAIFRPFWGTGGEMGNWDAELIDLLPDSVIVFASAGAGFDWADVKLLGEKGMIVLSPGGKFVAANQSKELHDMGPWARGLAAAEAVADFSVALIVGTFRALPYCISSAISPSSFQAAHQSATALSHNLRGHVLGLVGFGNIGQQIAQRCFAAFGMEITYYDIERKSGTVEAGLHARFCMTLESLIRGADCVVLCVPSSTGQIIDADSLRWFKPGARLVNVARGALVDEDALADALEQDRLSSAALDVHADEPNVSERLKKFAGTKALLTCHNAGGTVETHVGFEELCMRNIMAMLNGREAITPTNLEWLK